MAYDHPATLTQSKLTAFGCPARYHKLHVLGLSDTSDAARRGSTIHAANELYIAALVEDGEPSDADRAQNALADAIAAENTPPHLVAECETLWQNHVERFELDLPAFLEAEQRKTVGAFSFKPDFVYVRPDALEIHDLKTHFSALTEKAAKADLQARMSVLLASKVWPGFPTYSFTFHFIRLFQSVTVTFAPSDMDAIERQIEAHAEAIAEAERTGSYPAAPGATCAYCCFQCAIVDDANKLPARLLTVEDAQKSAGAVLAFKQAIKAHEAALAAYAGINGPVEVGGVQFAHRPSETVSFPAQKVIAALVEKGADVSGLSLGKTALRSFLQAKKWSHVKPALDALASVKHGTKFGAKKVGGGDETGEDE